VEAKQTPFNYIIGTILARYILFNKAIEPNTFIIVNSLLSLLKGLGALRHYYYIYSNIIKHANRLLTIIKVLGSIAFLSIYFI
jgi:predicted membrane-bound spermidine synthase